MKRRIIWIALIAVGVIAVLLSQAPQTSTIELNTCIQQDSGTCLRFPTVTGENLNGETATLPTFFTGDYQLVLVAFDREQQEGMINWLPIAEELQASNEALKFYSVGALPDVSAGIRLLISGGMSMAVEPDVRAVSILLYLDDQQAFASALGLADLDEPQILILNQEGDIIWKASAIFDPATIATLREQVSSLL